MNYNWIFLLFVFNLLPILQQGGEFSVDIILKFLFISDLC